VTGGLIVLFGIIVMVTVHEAGHFVAAKALGIKATEFFFGFGPRLWSTRRGETEYGIKAIPLGGYVRIIGMNPLEEVAPADLGRTHHLFQPGVAIVKQVLGRQMLECFTPADFGQLVRPAAKQRFIVIERIGVVHHVRATHAVKQVNVVNRMQGAFQLQIVQIHHGQDHHIRLRDLEKDRQEKA